MLRKIAYLTIVFLLITFASKAEGYRISINWSGIKDTSVFLAHHFDGKIYINDTIKLDNKGKGVFAGDKKLQEGLYVLYLNDKVYFDFLVGNDQEFSVSTDINSLYDKLEIQKAVESENFLAYQNYLREKSKLKGILETQLKDSDTTKISEAAQKMNLLDEEMIKYMNDEGNKYPGTMYSLFIKAADQVIIPEPEVGRDNPKYDSIVWFHYYNYRRDHFLDNINFNDERILYTPLLNSKLDAYFNKILIQSPDSIIPQAMNVINKSKGNPTMFQYISQYLLNNSVKSRIMGMDAVFLKIADEVYLSGQATWADSTKMRKIAEEAFLTRQNIIGKTAPELVMENINGEIESLHQVQAKLTVLLFWEPNCGHCKKEVPELYNKLFLNYMAKSVDLFSVCTLDDKKEWVEFVEKHGLTDWHNVWDPKHASKFRYKYNVQTTPLIYLLDKDKKIIAKKLDIDNLIKLIDALLK